MSTIDAVTSMTTWRWASHPNCLWLEIGTRDGITGLGETFYNAGAVEATVHDLIAPSLLGADPALIARHGRDFRAAAAFSGGGGAEARAYSAVDIALWDILGQASRRPIHALLGGRVRDRVAVYNSCADAGPYHDFTALNQRPGELAEELLAQGFTAMKLAPWDGFAPDSSGRFQIGTGGRTAVGPAGTHITPARVREGLAPLVAIRDRVGDRIEILLEGHSRWDLNSAIQIAGAAQPLGISWMEDFIQPDSPGDLRRLAEATGIPQAVSERLLGRSAFRQVLAESAARVVMCDVAWVGGISEASRVADLAEVYQLPFTPHDCTGPVTVLANLHLAAAKPNFMIAEVVRGFVEGHYRDVLNEPIHLDHGEVDVPQHPGLGATLSADFRGRPDVTSRTTR